MDFTLILQVGEQSEIRHFYTQIELEKEYFNLSRLRYNVPSAILIKEQYFGIPDAYYKLDKKYSLKNRESGAERRHIWEPVLTQDITKITEFQFNALNEICDELRLQRGESPFQRQSLNPNCWSVMLRYAELI